MTAFKNGESYSPKTAMYQHNCALCGAEFVGSLDKTYCSDACRLNAWRQRKKTPLAEQRPIGWARSRLAIFDRDKFRCVYCGRGPKDGAILHVDHVIAKANGGSDDPSNLVTACSSCNIGKGDTPLQNHPLA